MQTNLNNFADLQLELFNAEPSIRLRNPASARNLYGTAAEKIAVEALGLRRLRINNSPVCYDAQDASGRLFEIKSVKSGGAVPVWIWRMAKDLVAQADGQQISYVFVCHRSSGARSSDALWHGLSETVKEIFVVPLNVVARIHLTAPFGGMKLGLGESGYDRPGYREGYRRVSVKAIREVCSAYREHEFTVSGLPFSVKIYSE